MCQFIRSILEGNLWSIGDGTRLNFWTDKWLSRPIVDLLDIPSHLYLCLEASVSNFIQNRNHSGAALWRQLIWSDSPYNVSLFHLPSLFLYGGCFIARFPLMRTYSTEVAPLSQFVPSVETSQYLFFGYCTFAKKLWSWALSPFNHSWICFLVDLFSSWVWSSPQPRGIWSPPFVSPSLILKKNYPNLKNYPCPFSHFFHPNIPLLL